MINSNPHEKPMGNFLNKFTIKKIITGIRNGGGGLRTLANAGPITAISIIGLALALILSLMMLVFSTRRSKDPGMRTATQSRSFARELQHYDFYDAPRRVLSGENPAQIEKRLSRLQKQARGVEEQLSVLKRRRTLAMIDRQYTGAYEKAAREAAETFGYSAPIALIAADAAAYSMDARSLMKKYASRMSQYRFDKLELGVHILAGNLDNPSQAAEIPELERLLSLEIPNLPPQVRQDLQIDEFLLMAARGDIPGAALRVNTLINEYQQEENLNRMAAEFFYDNHNPFRAGELFSRLPNEQDIARAADALVFAGDIPGARNIWLALASPDNYKSIYNLAASSPSPEEELYWIGELLSHEFNRGNEGRNRTYSTIRYTRLKDAEQSVAILEELTSPRTEVPADPLLDLELLRRRLETLPPTRAAAEVWMLIGRNSEEEALYKWAAWYFDHQRLYEETARIIKEANRKGMTGSWTELHKSLALMRDGKLNEAEKVLKDASVSRENNRLMAAYNRDWRIPANLGRIQESRRAVSLALEYYEEAAAMAAEQLFTDRPAAALLQIRISRCLEALGRTQEAWRAMEYAVELDPENLAARRELRRF